MGDIETELSPCGLIRVEWHISDGLMSHVIRSPLISEVATGATILSLQDGMWDGAIAWLGGGRLTMDVRHYVRPANLSVAIDLPAGTFRLGAPGEGFADEPLAAIDVSFRREFARREKVALKRPRPVMSPLPGEKRGGLRDWLSYGLFVAAVIAAVVITLSEGR